MWARSLRAERQARVKSARQTRSAVENTPRRVGSARVFRSGAESRSARGGVSGEEAEVRAVLDAAERFADAADSDAIARAELHSSRTAALSHIFHGDDPSFDPFGHLPRDTQAARAALRPCSAPLARPRSAGGSSRGVRNVRPASAPSGRVARHERAELWSDSGSDPGSALTATEIDPIEAHPTAPDSPARGGATPSVRRSPDSSHRGGKNGAGELVEMLRRVSPDDEPVPCGISHWTDQGTFNFPSGRRTAPVEFSDALPDAAESIWVPLRGSVAGAVAAVMYTPAPEEAAEASDDEGPRPVRKRGPFPRRKTSERMRRCVVLCKVQRRGEVPPPRELRYKNRVAARCGGSYPALSDFEVNRAISRVQLRMAGQDASDTTLDLRLRKAQAADLLCNVLDAGVDFNELGLEHPRRSKSVARSLGPDSILPPGLAECLQNNLRSSLQRPERLRLTGTTRKKRGRSEVIPLKELDCVPLWHIDFEMSVPGGCQAGKALSTLENSTILGAPLRVVLEGMPQLPRNAAARACAPTVTPLRDGVQVPLMSLFRWSGQGVCTVDVPLERERFERQSFLFGGLPKNEGRQSRG
eukprot:Hpha_TRINITY_DN22668_c0_g1::TRINITY_DN22668_c0_g1_i1::g.192653::m.192653